MTIVSRYLEVARSMTSRTDDQSPRQRINGIIADLDTTAAMNSDEFRVYVIKRVLPSLCLALVALEKP